MRRIRLWLCAAVIMVLSMLPTVLLAQDGQENPTVGFVFDCLMWTPLIVLLVQFLKKWINVPANIITGVVAAAPALLPMVFKGSDLGHQLVLIIVCVATNWAAAVGTFKVASAASVLPTKVEIDRMAASIKKDPGA